MEYHGDVGALALRDLGIQETGSACEKLGAPRHKILERHQAWLLVVAQAARILIDDVRRESVPRADRQELIVLSLILRDADLGTRAAERGPHLFLAPILKGRHRNGAEHLAGAHGPVKLRPVVTDQRYPVSPLHADRGQSGGNAAHLTA